ncbi:MAG: DNA recombination protein RmuC [Ignavibacteriae bacterium HGW-Ignavibacteriae-2]|jgi:DNA recombination protein RmuC|nr:MAG: DNA recombination protein RmuC [Ignavibacteriae bacterium HGW-Ignavibacteriae-2]
MEILFLVIGIVSGGVIIYFMLKSKSAGEKAQLNERNFLLEKDLNEKKELLSAASEKYIKINSELASLQSDYKNLQQKMDDQKNEIENLESRFAKEFENLANRIFEDKSSKFTQQNKDNLSEILNPLSLRIKEFEQKVEDKHNKDTEARAGLVQQIKMLYDLNQQMTKEANNLTKALRGDQKTQGNWGEFILESVLEKSGLSKGREYTIQESFKSEDGNLQRPDVIVYLPENKNIIIDSKVSLTAYEQCVSADDEALRISHLNNHIKSVRSHIKLLSQKNYQNLYELNTPDFVLMFMPIEPAFALAVQHDAALFQEAFDKNIVIVSPSTLLATLRTIASIWRQESQNKNALEIARQSGALYDKFVGFVDDLVNIGKRLDSTQDTYKEAMKKLQDGSGNLIRRTERLKELGAKTSKILPTSLLDGSDED